MAKRLQFKIDTGAQCNVMSKQKYLTLSQSPLQKSKDKLTAFGGHKLHTCGKAVIPCKHNDHQYLIEFEAINQIKTLLPTSNKLLEPRTIHPKTVQSELTKRKEKQKFYYDRHTKPLNEFSKGDQVMMKGRDKWQPATVLNKSAAQSCH